MIRSNQVAISRQLCALILMLAFSAGIALPAWAAIETNESCCRRAGKHACCKRYSKTKTGTKAFQALSGCQKKCCQQAHLPTGLGLANLFAPPAAELEPRFERLRIAGTGRVVPTTLPQSSFQRPPPSLS